MTQPQPSAPQQPQPEPGPRPSPPPFNIYALIAIVATFSVVPPLGIYFGHLARRQIRETGERGIELARVAIILGWVAIAIIAIFCSALFMA